METKPNKEQSPIQVPISLGTLFTVWENGNESPKVDIVLDIGEPDGDFESAQIHNEGGKQYFGIGGGRGAEDFGHKVGQLTLSEVIEAAKLGAKKTGISFEGMEKILMRYAHKGTRILKINRR